MLELTRETLLKPLRLVTGVLERRQTMPILGNVLLSVDNNPKLNITATDSEIELVAAVELTQQVDFPSITTSGRKLFDIVNMLPEQAVIKLDQKSSRILLTSGRSRFSLSTLAAEDFPNTQNEKINQSLSLPQSQLKQLLEKTHFSMSHQDVRYYLNGLLLEATAGELRAVSTDGHRLSLAKYKNNDINQQVKSIIPRKGVMELMRLLEHNDEKITVEFGDSHIAIQLPKVNFISKLIEGNYPDYQRFIPQTSVTTIDLNVQEIKQSLSRVAILSHQKSRGVRLMISDNSLKIMANNSDQEVAEEELEINYHGDDLELSFNVNYLLDIITSLPHSCETMTMIITTANNNSSTLFEPKTRDGSLYLVMPMRL